MTSNFSDGDRNLLKADSCWPSAIKQTHKHVTLQDQERSPPRKAGLTHPQGDCQMYCVEVEMSCLDIGRTSEVCIDEPRVKTSPPARATTLPLWLMRSGKGNLMANERFKQTTRTPTRKVWVGSVAGALSAILVWIFNDVIQAGFVIPASIASAITTLIYSLIAYFVSPSPSDGIVRRA